jgi:hypothetical protein
VSPDGELAFDAVGLFDEDYGKDRTPLTPTAVVRS